MLFSFFICVFLCNDIGTQKVTRNDLFRSDMASISSALYAAVCATNARFSGGVVANVFDCVLAAQRWFVSCLRLLVFLEEWGGRGGDTRLHASMSAPNRRTYGRSGGEV